MSIIDLSSFTSKLGTTTAVWLYDEAETYVVQHDFLHMSFYREDLRDFDSTYATWWCRRTDTILGTYLEELIQI